MEFCPRVHWVDMLWSRGIQISRYKCSILQSHDFRRRCHLGKTIVYDTVSNLSWSVDVRTHGIVTVIEKILGEPWPPSVEVGREVPEAVPQEDCVVSGSSISSIHVRGLDADQYHLI